MKSTATSSLASAISTPRNASPSYLSSLLSRTYPNPNPHYFLHCAHRHSRVPDYLIIIAQDTDDKPEETQQRGCYRDVIILDGDGEGCTSVLKSCKQIGSLLGEVLDNRKVTLKIASIRTVYPQLSAAFKSAPCSVRYRTTAR